MKRSSLFHLIQASLTLLAKSKTYYHLTDKANFRLDPKKVPADNAVAIHERKDPGLFLADQYQVSHWVQLQGYVRPFVVEIDVPEEVLRSERWGGEKFLPADKFSQAKITRVIPLDAFCRETYNEYGWTEEDFRTTFDTNEPIEFRLGRPVKRLPAGYRYEGDVRTTDPAWIAYYKNALKRTNAHFDERVAH